MPAYHALFTGFADAFMRVAAHEHIKRTSRRPLMLMLAHDAYRVEGCLFALIIEMRKSTPMMIFDESRAAARIRRYRPLMARAMGVSAICFISRCLRQSKTILLSLLLIRHIHAIRSDGLLS